MYIINIIPIINFSLTRMKFRKVGYCGFLLCLFSDTSHQVVYRFLVIASMWKLQCISDYKQWHTLWWAQPLRHHSSTDWQVRCGRVIASLGIQPWWNLSNHWNYLFLKLICVCYLMFLIKRTYLKFHEASIDLQKISRLVNIILNMMK